MTAPARFPTKAQIVRAITAAKEAGATRVRLPGGVAIDLAPLDGEPADDFTFDHEDHNGPAPVRQPDPA